MRYVWASVVAIVILLFGVHLVRHTHEGVERMVRKAAADSGRPMPDLSASKTPDVGIEVSGIRLAQIEAADILSDYWYVFVVLVLLSCFGVAALVGRRSRSSLSSPQTTEP
jgi:hypothetical protein